jgi:hypothetical protein
MNFSEQTLKTNPDVVFTIVDDEAILLQQQSGKYFSLNAVGARMWLLLDEYGRLDKVLEQLLAEFDVEEERLREDLERMVAQFIESGLLT